MLRVVFISLTNKAHLALGPNMLAYKTKDNYKGPIKSPNFIDDKFHIVVIFRIKMLALMF